MNKEHIMSKEEKEKFLNRVKIEVEDVCEDYDPKQEFITKVESYQQNMQKQIIELEKLIKVQKHLMNAVETLYNNVANDLPKDILKSEIATKQEVIMQAHTSMILMRERIALGDKLKYEWNNKYDFLNDLDFYFNGALGMPETEKRKDDILKQDKKNTDAN